MASKTAQSFAVVATGGQAETADQSRREIADDVAVEVLEQEDVELAAGLVTIFMQSASTRTSSNWMPSARRSSSLDTSRERQSRKSPSAFFMMLGLDGRR